MNKIQEIKQVWYKNPKIKFNVSTKERKDIMLNENLNIIFQGEIYDIKFKNLGGGVWEIYTEKKLNKYDSSNTNK